MVRIVMEVGIVVEVGIVIGVRGQGVGVWGGDASAFNQDKFVFSVHW